MIRKTKYLVFGVGVLTACVSSFMFSRPVQAADESLTLETYYPAPYGSYAELTTTSNTYLATEGGNVVIGTTSPSGPLSDMPGNLDVNDIRVRAGDNGNGRWATDNWLVCDRPVFKVKSGSSPSVTWGENAHPVCPSNYQRTGCVVSCNGTWNESDVSITSDNGCTVGINDSCVGSKPSIKVTAICCRTK